MVANVGTENKDCSYIFSWLKYSQN